jgi:hypothetical protein
VVPNPAVVPAAVRAATVASGSKGAAGGAKAIAAA